MVAFWFRVSRHWLRLVVSGALGDARRSSAAGLDTWQSAPPLTRRSFSGMNEAVLDGNGDALGAGVCPELGKRGLCMGAHGVRADDELCRNRFGAQARRISLQHF